MPLKIALIVFVLAAAPSPAPTGSPTPAAIPSSTAAPSPSASPVLYQYVTKFPFTLVSLAQSDTPQVFEVDFNDRSLSSGAPLSVRIFTSLNVNAVYASVAGRGLGNVPPIEPGHFEMSSSLPHIPFAVRGRTYHVRFEAQTIDGRKTSVEVPIFIRW